MSTRTRDKNYLALKDLLENIDRGVEVQFQAHNDWRIVTEPDRQGYHVEIARSEKREWAELIAEAVNKFIEVKNYAKTK